MTIGIGILGAGMIATTDVGVLPGMRLLTDRARVWGIASRTRASSDRAAAAFGIPRVYDNLDQMLDDDDIDVIVNLTSIDAHFQTSLQILESGRHLVTEKPFASSVAEADELLRAATDRRLEVVVASPRMIEPSRERAAELVASGALGQVTLARARVSHAGAAGMTWPTDPRPAYRAGAGPLRDLGPYAIEQLAGLVGPIVRVSCISTISRSDFAAYGDGPFGGVAVHVETPDTVVLACELVGGALAVVDCSFGPVQASSPNIEVFGLEGSLELWTRYGQDLGPRLRTYRRGRDRPGVWTDADTASDTARQRRINELGRAVLVEHLLDVLDGSTPNRLTAQAGRHVVAVIAAAEESARSGRAEVVKAPPSREAA